MGAGMAVAANNRHARLGYAQLRTDYMNDTLVSMAQPIQFYTMIFTIFNQLINLYPPQFVLDWQVLILGRHIVIGGGNNLLRP